MTNTATLEVPKSVQGPTLPQVRDLPFEEWDRLRAFEPWASGGLPPQETCRMIVAERDGPGSAIVGFWALSIVLHAEPLWIAPEFRCKPGLVRRLWTGITDLMRTLGASTAFACIMDADAPNGPLAARLGFKKLSGDLYMLTLPPVPPAARKD